MMMMMMIDNYNTITNNNLIYIAPCLLFRALVALNI